MCGGAEKRKSEEDIASRRFSFFAPTRIYIHAITIRMFHDPKNPGIHLRPAGATLTGVSHWHNGNSGKNGEPVLPHLFHLLYYIRLYYVLLHKTRQRDQASRDQHDENFFQFSSLSYFLVLQRPFFQTSVFASETPFFQVFTLILNVDIQRKNFTHSLTRTMSLLCSQFSCSCCVSFLLALLSNVAHFFFCLFSHNTISLQ